MFFLRKCFFCVLFVLLSTNVLAAELPEGIHVHGVGTVIVVPDTAHMTIRIHHTDKVADTAKARVNSQVNKIFGAVDDLGVPEKNIRASGIRVQPEYRYNNNARHFVGMRVERTISITLRDLKKLARLSDAIIAVDVDYLSPPRLSYSKRNEAEIEALALAVTNAKAKALAITKVTDVELGRAVYITEQSVSRPQFRAYNQSAQVTFSEAGSSTETKVLTGQSEVIARVNVRFLLVD